MFEFLLYSRTGRTDGNFQSLREGGSLDVVYQCILMALFRSHALRRDVVFHAILGGPPKPPLHLQIDGRKLKDVRTDERSWEGILKNVLRGKTHPGITVKKESLQELVRRKREEGFGIFVLEENGKSILELSFSEPSLFVLGDQVGLPRKEEKFVLRFAEKISLGRQRYLSASCVDIVNFFLDSQDITRKREI
ncbi:MAG: tRNA (pseudouridine(54)-N(1))-methyltransferase TrmY [Thermoplasmata archaeon]